jgi:hypothetical protein
MTLLVAGIAFAEAGSRSITTTGPNGGTVHRQGTVKCQYGVCTSSQTLTGVNGNVYTRSGSTSCSNGTCSGEAVYTGPRGKTVKRFRYTTP